jgi:hypothetical protein
LDYLVKLINLKVEVAHLEFIEVLEITRLLRLLLFVRDGGGDVGSGEGGIHLVALESVASSGDEATETTTSDEVIDLLVSQVALLLLRHHGCTDVEGSECAADLVSLDGRTSLGEERAELATSNEFIELLVAEVTLEELEVLINQVALLLLRQQLRTDVESGKGTADLVSLDGGASLGEEATKLATGDELVELLIAEIALLLLAVGNADGCTYGSANGSGGETGLHLVTLRGLANLANDTTETSTSDELVKLLVGEVALLLLAVGDANRGTNGGADGSSGETSLHLVTLHASADLAENGTKLATSDELVELLIAEITLLLLREHLRTDVESSEGTADLVALDCRASLGEEGSKLATGDEFVKLFVSEVTFEELEVLINQVALLLLRQHLRTDVEGSKGTADLVSLDSRSSLREEGPELATSNKLIELLISEIALLLLAVGDTDRSSNGGTDAGSGNSSVHLVTLGGLANLANDTTETTTSLEFFELSEVTLEEIFLIEELASSDGSGGDLGLGGGGSGSVGGGFLGVVDLAFLVLGVVAVVRLVGLLVVSAGSLLLGVGGRCLRRSSGSRDGCLSLCLGGDSTSDGFFGSSGSLVLLVGLVHHSQVTKVHSSTLGTTSGAKSCGSSLLEGCTEMGLGPGGVFALGSVLSVCTSLVSGGGSGNDGSGGDGSNNDGLRVLHDDEMDEDWGRLRLKSG